MNNKATSIRPFIGAKDYDLSRSFYRDLGFEEVVLSNDMSLFKIDQLGFYLQHAYVKDWIDNSMIFLEVDDGWTPGSLAMEKDDKGIWSFTTDILNPELYTYWSVIDGFRTTDPNNPFLVRDVASIMNVFYRWSPGKFI